MKRQGKTVLFYIVGRKGRPVIQRVYPKAIIGQHDTSAMKAPGYADAQAIADDIIDRFDSGQFDVAHLAYSEFKSVLVQEPTGRPDHPGRSRRRGRRHQRRCASAAVEYEPDEEEILADAAAAQRRHADLSRAARECRRLLRQPDDRDGQCHAQRRRHDQPLSIQYNRQRQAAITTELVEIISGAEAL